MKRTAFLAFVFVTALYIVLGSLVFHFIEGENEKEQKKTFELDHEKFLDSHTCLTREALLDYMLKVKQAYAAGVPVMAIVLEEMNGSHGSTNASTTSTTTASTTTNASTNASLLSGHDVHHESKWDLASTILFSLTVVSTIGYGNLAPKTSGGQAFCIIFALIGIPLFATCLVGVGERLQIPLQRIKKCKAWYKKDPKKDEQLKTGVFLTSGICLLIFIPSYVLSRTEDWTYIEALYFCIITLTTVGFGDYIPGRSHDIMSFYMHRIVLGVWILLGLSWVALIFSELASVMKEQIMEAARKTSNKFVDLEGMVKKKAKDARERIVQKDRDHDVSGISEEVDFIVEDDIYVIKSSPRESSTCLSDEENGIPGVYRSLGSERSLDSNSNPNNEVANKDSNSNHSRDAPTLEKKCPDKDEPLSRVDVRLADGNEKGMGCSQPATNPHSLNKDNAI